MEYKINALVISSEGRPGFQAKEFNMNRSPIMTEELA
jgi:hypothetical protein